MPLPAAVSTSPSSTATMVASVSSMLATVVVVILYAAFLMMEQRFFEAKLAQASGDPRNAARIREGLTGLRQTYASAMAGAMVVVVPACAASRIARAEAAPAVTG